jgi:probable rRNA maturation factor
LELIVEFINTNKKQVGIDESLIKKIISIIFNEEKKTAGNLSIVICNDEYLLKINKKFLDRNYLTDVIAFGESFKNSVNGNVFISYDRILENAEIYSENNVKKELLRILVHGLLHLAGYNDKSDKEKSLMTQKENFYLNQLSLHF